ncbi:MAG: ATP-dependent RNA helicase DbpA [Candidatus Thiodiazotropha lotti]|nr:ATP-dependent RNA helicase DbpA [Candidatus Thiodiazotropha lotti]ODC00679.1 ATP-dependent RNA helicase DbpA [Candidatus Thiodiazotropha endoloripes]MCG7920130.1 ATP-dependent RNA helicase DbpA [Candidatus Thiodiazotropha lotti]MCG7928497.1 ATP-dependent RNA helicase DbpA [Candidatus Thiodiazotropha lotti]MCG7985937.1 ATP-dependent RNA helicase DbpA [Candidatus Thiodiazotropha lotti]
MTTRFSSLKLAPALLGNLESLGYLQMTPIQAESLPHVLAGRDLIARAKTGSGKTVAFGLGLLSHLKQQSFSVQALVLCPTRELADQVAKELRRLARTSANTKIITLCGGTPFGPQIGSLEHGAHIVVGTPGRILKHLAKGTLSLDSVGTVVLDEADRMLDMGFHDDMTEILSVTPSQRQTLLFSATYPETIRELSSAFQSNPIEVTVDSHHSDLKISQHFYEVGKGKRTQTLAALLAQYKPISSVVFCHTKLQSQEVAEELQQRGIQALALHGDLEQKERDLVLVRFANGSVPVLVATDVAARGLDIKELGAVINYELPRDPEIYVHRIGRTGRAGNKGLALNLFIASEANRVNAIEAYLNSKVRLEQPPGLELPESFSITAPNVTLCIDGGRKEKVRPGDILGALTANGAIAGNRVGKIDIFDHLAYVAVDRSVRKIALRILSENNIKGRRFKVRMKHWMS